MGKPIESLLGRKGQTVMCKIFNKDIAVHWFNSGAKVGDKCLCGKITKKPLTKPISRKDME